MDSGYLKNIDNIVSVFREQCRKYMDNTMLRIKVEGIYREISWKEVMEMVEAVSLYLLESGVKKGDRIALYAFNRFEWWVADMASLSVGAVVVPVYATNSQDEVRYILENSGSSYVFTGDAEQRDKVIACSRKYRKIKLIMSFDDLPRKKNCINFITMLANGMKSTKKKALDARTGTIASSDTATIIYTSGTTGDPKGVVLTHENIYTNVVQLVDVFGNYVEKEDIFLSFLPLSHALERTAGYYTPIALGCQVAFAESFATIQDDMKKIRPTIFVSVPRLYEKIYAGVQMSSRRFPAYKRLMFRTALAIGTMRVPYVTEFREPGRVMAKLIWIAEKLIFSKIKAALGMDKLKISISGGGPLSVSELDFFLGMDIKIYEGFGLTESSPVTNVNRPGRIKPGTVGPAMCMTEVRISDDGEVLFRSPSIMTAYYRNPAATKEAFTSDGWLRSGDIGFIDEEGFLTITGRIKDIIVTAGGKNISPQNIENHLKKSGFIEQLAILGDRRKFISCLVVPDFSALKVWSKKNKKEIDFSNNESVINNKEVIALIESELLKLTKDFSRVEQVKKFRLIPDEWSVETGELTPSLKIKRKVIEEKYKHIINEIYE